VRDHHEAVAPRVTRPEPAVTTADIPQPRAPDPAPAALLAGQFRDLAVVKSAHGVQTLVGMDRATDRHVVVKVARAGDLSQGARLRLEHEAAVLESLDAPGLVPLVRHGTEHGLVYLVMPFVEGEPLDRRLRRGRLAATDALVVGRDLLAALSHVHAHGVLHRDVKPSNVVVTGRHEVSGAVLVDFGLARSHRLDVSIREQTVGTARYMSPEQAGLLPHEVDERSDLYAVGVLLFEALAGHPPFRGESVGAVLREHVTAAPPDLRGLGVDVPGAVDEIVQRLLRKDPRDRYQSADGARHDVDAVLAGLRDGVRDPVVSIGAHDRRRTLTEPAFVGRERELGALAEEVGRADAGNGRVVFVEAESGGGKSRLLDEFAQRCANRGVRVLRGQGVDQAARRPFEMLRHVAGDLLAADEAYQQRVVAGLTGVVDAVRDALPELVPILPRSGDETLGPEEHGEARSVHALAQLLDSLGTERRPAVLVLDDCQWADELTVSLLHHWQRARPEGEACHLAVVAAFRTEEVATDHPLRRLRARRIGLPPFPAREMRSLVESMAGPVPDEALALVTGLAAGSPFMASAVLRGLVESGALVDTPTGWQVDQSALRQAQSSREAAVFLARRLDLLPAETLRLLGAAAVLGKEFDLALAAALVGYAPAAAFGALEEARRRHILWLRDDAATGMFVHDKLRESLLDRLAPDERADLHLQAARFVEATDTERVFEIAYHFHAAGDAASALPYALRAGEQARRRHALQVAEQQYRIAADAAPHAGADTRRIVAEGLGDVLMLRGHYDDAETELGRALDLTSDHVERARIAARLGEVSFKRGDVTTSIDRLEGALRLLGRRVPRNDFGFLMGVVWEALVQTLHTLLPDAWFSRRSLASPKAEVDLLAGRVYSRLAYSYWFGKGKVPCGWTHLREMNLLERYPATLELAQAYSEHAPVATTIPWYARGIAYAERSYAIRLAHGDVWGQGQSLHFHGVALYAATRYEEALAKLAEAIRLLERTGDQWEINTAAWNIALCYYRLGDLPRAAALAQRVHRTAADIGDHASSAISLSVWAKAANGDVPADALAAELGRATDDLHTTSEVHLGEALRLLHEGSSREAADLIAGTERLVRTGGLHMEYVAPVPAWLATARRAVAEALPAHLGKERARELRAAARSARRARRMARRYRNNLPHALREQGLVAVLQGRRRRARRLLARSVEVAVRQHQARDEHDARAAYVRYGTSLGWPGVDEQAAALAAFDVEVAPEDADDGLRTLSLADRFDGVLSAGRGIASALSPDAVFAEVRTAALALLRAESSVVAHVDAETGTLSAGDSSSGPSADLMRRALAAGRPVTWAPSHDATDSLTFSGTRSALAAPIFVRGRIVACFGVTHRQVTGLFGEDEVRLAEFVSAIAGAALENADGFVAVQDLSRSLEQRVEERTEALRSALRQLEVVNAELRALDEMKSDFVAMVSHELKTPLTSILGYSSTMLRYWDSLPDGDRMEYVRTIDRQSHRLARLVSDLLEMSRIEAGYLDTSPQDVDVAAAVASLLGSYDEAPDVAVDLPAGLVVRADPDHLHQILTNYLDNARKYGFPPLRVDAYTEGAFVVLAVSDGGRGVPEEFVPRLFDKFAQASTGSRRGASGTGLGLSIVRGLARANGGEVCRRRPVAADVDPRHRRARALDGRARRAAEERQLPRPEPLLRRVGQLLAEAGSASRRPHPPLGVTHNHSSPYYSTPSAGVWLFQDVMDLRASSTRRAPWRRASSGGEAT
jgi:signal transduction histidine kinase/tetratricopeptide (TPR) repeat protein